MQTLLHLFPGERGPTRALVRLTRRLNSASIVLVDFTLKKNELFSTVVLRQLNVGAFEVVGFPHSSVGKESACNAGDPGSIPGSGRSPEERIGYPLQDSWASLWLSW